MIPTQKLKSAEKNKTDMEHYGTCVDTGNNTALLRFCPQKSKKRDTRTLEGGTAAWYTIVGMVVDGTINTCTQK